jgi:glycosyltransferase involved in cell wall biosynthesis
VGVNLRVALLVAKIEPGGLLEVNRRLREILSHEGHQVDLIGAVTTPEQVDTHVENYISLGAKSSSRSFFKLRALFSSQKYDVVIVSQLFLGVIALASRSKRSASALILVEHSSLDYWRHSPRIKDRIALLLSRYFLGHKADCLASVSRKTTQDINDQFKWLSHPAVYLPNPILSGNEPIFGDTQVNSSGRSNFVFAGRISREKRVGDIINAYAAIASQTQDDLIILGDGPERLSCQLLTKSLEIEHRVHFYGFVSNVSDYLCDAKSLILASSHEGLPTVLVEALAFGAKVISTDCPTGPGEILAGGKFGKLVGVGHVDELARALTEISNLENDLDELRDHLWPYTYLNSVAEYEKAMKASILIRRESRAR